MSSTATDKEKCVPDWALAKQGLNMLINNNSQNALDLFLLYPDSLPMCAGYSFAVFMDALMTFEDDKLALATSTLKDVERKCSSETGWLKSVKRAFTTSDSLPLAESLETQIILADSQVCLAILTFLQQDISGYFKGGWVLRKAWKVYQSAYQDILRLYKGTVGEVDKQLPDAAVEQLDSGCSTPDAAATSSSPKPEPALPNGYTRSIPTSHSAILSSTPSNRFLKKSFSVSGRLSKEAGKSEWSSFTTSLSLSYFTSFHLFTSSAKIQNEQIDKDTIERLMGAVSFGYGLLQLGISLLPPSLLKVTNFLGFGGNRQSGIACLMYARQGIDMRAPLATLSLLWYHTIVRPFYALDGSNVQAGVNAATQLLDDSEEEYGQSALFLFFKGRVNRLRSDIPTALRSFQLSVDNAAQREIKILALHEVGWCHLIQLDYCSAESTFSYLKSWSRWSRAFYNYLSGICGGCCPSSIEAGNAKEIRSTLNGGYRNNQLDEFLARRAKCCPEDDSKVSPAFWRLLVYEMLYLWNALPSCSLESVEQIRRDCEDFPQGETDREPMVGLSKLIIGCCYCMQNQFGSGVDSFKACLSLRKNLASNAEDAHVSAFTHYEIGALLIKSNETKEEGKIHLQSVSNYKDYDFEQRLSVRVHSMLKQL